MSEAAADDPSAPRAPQPEPEPRRTGRRVLAAAGVVTLAAVGATWVARERIADGLIASQLRELGLPATYRIVAIGPRRQVLRDIVIGDPRHPDLTIAEAEIALSPRLGLPAIGTVRLVRPRLYGTWQGDRVSFGRLDSLLFGQRDGQSAGLPRLDLTVIDGRARLTGDHGPVGAAFEGRGGLFDGFDGTLGIRAPRLALAGCEARGASLYGRVRIVQGKPTFAGPLRTAVLDCPGRATLSARAVQLDLAGQADATLDGGTVRVGLQSGQVSAGELRSRSWTGAVDATFRQGGVTARYDLTGRGLDQPQVGAATLALSGLLRAREGLGRFETEGTLDAGGLRVGRGLAAAIDGWQRAGEGTLVAPLLRQVRASLAREERGSRLQGDFVLRGAPQGVSLVVPQGRLTGGSGSTLLALSRLQLTLGQGTPRLAGNFTTGGEGLPQMTGRLAQGVRGWTRLTMAMADYRAGDARLAIPRLTLVQQGNGALNFGGVIVASGAVPGGQATNLTIPLDGARDVRGTLVVGRRCLPVRFDALTLANLSFDQQALSLCPSPGAAILQSGRGGTRLALGIPALDLTGRLGETPLRIASGPVGFAAPGSLFARALEVTLGPPQSASHVRLSDLRAEVGRTVSGHFGGADVRLAAVPLDLVAAQGAWRFAAGRLSIADATFDLQDRTRVARFEPLRGDQATLALVDNVLTAAARLREPQSGREVARVDLRHDLARARGHADVRVAGLEFDKALQPGQLTRQLLGVVANVRGRVAGAGRIDWTAEQVRSTGRFRTDGLDLAAAFGPAQGIRGEVEFSDLLGLVTPPHQRVTIAAVNPGIEVNDGELRFQLRPGGLAAIEGAAWPFLGGRLQLRPAEMRFGVEETRRFVLDIEALDAGHFIERMELANLSASGAFDGTLPLVFDQNGGRIEGGMLQSRPPGGNLSYVGALTYRDLSPIANFAFDALRSLDYRTMRIAMDGALEGEIVTRVRFDGVKQGAGAKRNFVTRRFARLPLQFNVNLRAPFYSLISSVKAMYDPAYIKDPRTLGLVDAQGRPVAPVARPAGPRIQPPVSETTP
ncbi:YdbH domain-containing protein [Novosphingobium piscinae]|uniref:YdbH domain-containing protein n=1 Tax=Novosphingobium piscinae TaxID=1507448 RepID=A0A7X1FW25_9SPHN|nr:YdbH domain-containing protein [Novosphingobium piscinae]MBC2668035.1 YdbH domain-containing protein [Novosphingobium piscinae]